MLPSAVRFWKRRFGAQKEWYAMVDDIFGICPGNIELYKLALIHRSASIFLDNGTHINNERLEYLGDAILEAVVSDYIFIEFPDRDEGFMTQLRSKIVSRVSLNDLAEKIGLARHVISHSGGNNQHKNLYGDAMEAMIGAIYLDKGYDFTNRLLINGIFRKYIDIEALTEQEIDFKSRLIEWCQKSRRTISFRTTTTSFSTTHSPCFISHVIIDGQESGFGEGGSKKEAEQNAACLLSGLIMSDINSERILDMLDEGEQQSDEAL